MDDSPSDQPEARHPSRSRATAAVAPVTVAGALVAGCAVVTPPAPLDAAALRNHSIEVTAAPAPSFYADNKDRRRFGLVGVFVMAHEGNRIVRLFNLADPSIALAASLRESIARMNPGTGAKAPESGAPAGAQLAVRVQTTNWEYRPFRGHADQYYVIYAARIDLIDNASGRLLARERCEVTPTVDARLTEEDLLANGARRLHAELAASSSLCLAMLREKPMASLFGLPPTVARR